MRSLRSHKRTPSGAGCAIQTYDTIRVHFFTALILFFGVIIRTDESLRCSALRPDDMTTANIVFERQLPRIFALYCTRPVLVLHCAFYSPNESLHSLRSGRGGGGSVGTERWLHIKFTKIFNRPPTTSIWKCDSPVLLFSFALVLIVFDSHCVIYWRVTRKNYCILT